MRVGPGLALIALLTSTVQAADESSARLMDAVRKDDIAAVKALLRAGAKPNSPAENGDTPLMYAAAFASPECLRLLLDRRADVNGHNDFGATALMWAASEPDKVRLLIERGADVNAKTRDGQTALEAAAFYPRNSEVARLLLKAGADARAVDKNGVGLLRLSYGKNDPALHETVRAAGLEIEKLDQLGPFPMLNVLQSRDRPLIERVLELKADVNEAVQSPAAKVSILAALANFGEAAAVETLLEHGADPNRAYMGGPTALMMAAASDRPDAKIVLLLIRKGAALNAQDGNGRTALDWALTQGETEISRLLRESGGKAMAARAPDPKLEGTRDVRAALAAAMPRLLPVSQTFFQHYACISCHNMSLPAVAATRARERGVQVDAAQAAHPDKATMSVWRPNRELLMLGNGDAVGGFVANVSYGLFSMREEAVPPNPITDAAALCLARAQEAEGSWNILDTRPPLGVSRIKYTALVIRGVPAFLPEGRRNEWKQRLERALRFLRVSEPKDTQDAAFLLLGLKWAGAPAAEVETASARLLGLQREDGGWAQLPGLAPDAYATGQALAALNMSGALPASHPAYQKGVRRLLRSQLPDGTWFVRSRAFGFQPYFDAGFPHGHDQFISAAASSWAAIALAAAL